jgi:ribosomal protein L37AE/L43A
MKIKRIAQDVMLDWNYYYECPYCEKRFVTDLSKNNIKYCPCCGFAFEVEDIDEFKI